MFIPILEIIHHEGHEVTRRQSKRFQEAFFSCYSFVYLCDLRG